MNTHPIFLRVNFHPPPQLLLENCKILHLASCGAKSAYGLHLAILHLAEQKVHMDFTLGVGCILHLVKQKAAYELNLGSCNMHIAPFILQSVFPLLFISHSLHFLSCILKFTPYLQDLVFGTWKIVLV